jgi:DNA-binding NtrC family response regulator
MDDIPVLVRYFVEKKAESFGIPSFPLISEEEMHSLLMYPWPGNVRELEHAVDRALVNKRMHPDKKGLHFELIPLPEEQSAHAEKKEAGASMALLRKEGEWPSLREMEDRYIREVLEHCGGKLTGADSATSLLDIHYTTLRTRMRRMGLMPDDE